MPLQWFWGFFTLQKLIFLNEDNELGHAIYWFRITKILPKS
jgi:hypothetical protein